MPKASCLKVPKDCGEKSIVILRSKGLLNSKYRIHSEQDVLCLPLLRELESNELNELKKVASKIETETCSFLEREAPPSLDGLLEGRLPPHALASVSRAIDFVGDIAIVEVAPELKDYRQVIGQAILTAHKNMRTVLAKSGAIEGLYRLRAFETLAGEAKTVTVHKEYGCVFHVDLAKAYFSPRLSYEHSRVASLVQEQETVLDMFAGVGVFSILIARRLGNVRVYAVDINPDAYELLRKNVSANHVVTKVKPILGDARAIINEKLTQCADRVIMNLPEKAIEYVDAACMALKREGGIIHYYEFSDSSTLFETAKSRLAEAIGQTNRRLNKVLHARIVRGIAPFSYQVVVDALVK